MTHWAGLLVYVIILMRVFDPVILFNGSGFVRQEPHPSWSEIQFIAAVFRLWYQPVAISSPSNCFCSCLFHHYLIHKLHVWCYNLNATICDFETTNVTFIPDIETLTHVNTVSSSKTSAQFVEFVLTSLGFHICCTKIISDVTFKFIETALCLLSLGGK